METSGMSIFQFSIIIFLFVGGVIFVGFRLIRYLMQFFRFAEVQRRLLIRYLPMAELIAWILFLLWGSQYLFSRSPLITLIPLLVLLVLLLYLAWYTLKDITAGVIFKTGQTHRIHDHIEVAGVKGKIVAIGLRNLEIEDYDGRTISIPYSRVTGHVLLRSHPSQSLLSHSFVLQIEHNQPTDIFALKDRIRIQILSLPWASQKKEPRIEILEEKESHSLFHITIFSLDEMYFQKTQKLLAQQFNAIIKS